MENFFNNNLLPMLDSVDAWVAGHGLAALGGLGFVFAVILGIVVWKNRYDRKLQQLQLDAKTHELNDLSEQLQLQQHEAGLQQQRNHEYEVQLGVLETRNSALGDRLEELGKQLHASQAQLESSRNAEQHSSQQLAEKREALASRETQLAQYRQWWEQAQQTLVETQQQHTKLKDEYTQLKTSLEEKQAHFNDQIALLNDAKAQMKKDFELLANEILERKGKAFKEINQESIEHLLTPIRHEMKGFREKVETIHTEEIRQRSELKAELVNLQKLNQEITDQADRLTTALQGQKKMQGNWGELMLENVLDSSGLRAGKDYQREVSIKTENGRQRPDAVVYLPQGKHMIIDAKTSLVAYTRYVNADNDLERETALAEHTRAVSDRINELADRDYYRLPGLNSPEVVIMFIPIESAYVEALRHDETLYQRAIERNVLVATPTTLLTSLNIVRQLWQFEDRNKHTAELASRAEKFYNKLNSFLGSMQAVGVQLDKARDSYDKAFSQLYSGRGNLIKQASDFRELGVSVQKELPQDLRDKASLELDTPLVSEEPEPASPDKIS
ncbi:MAG: DNA recombination protein RmuC [Chromatiales bacterium]|jgi:DNA recombination protein RmuC